MGQYDDGGQAKKPEGIFDSLLRDLHNEVCQAETDAETYKKHVNKLDMLVLECDLKKQEKELSDPSSPVDVPYNVTCRLRTLLDQLKTINGKNGEILKHFDTLV